MPDEEIPMTFHGRDIFAPVAAHIARGVPLNRIGTAAASAELDRLPGLESSRSEDGEIAGKIVSVDHFGNLITNIPAHELEDLCTGRPGRSFSSCCATSMPVILGMVWSRITRS